MTAVDSTSCPTDTAIFKPFQWHMKETERASLPGIAVMNFATEAHDISQGARIILEIIEVDSLAEATGDRKLLNENASGHLLRMAITSLRLLGSASEEIMDWAHKYHTPEGRRENETPRQTATA